MPKYTSTPPQLGEQQHLSQLFGLLHSNDSLFTLNAYFQMKTFHTDFTLQHFYLHSNIFKYCTPSTTLYECLKTPLMGITVLPFEGCLQ